MNGATIYLNKNQKSAVIACENDDCMAIDIEKPGTVSMGYMVDTCGLWLGECGKMLNQTANEAVVVAINTI